MKRDTKKQQAIAVGLNLFVIVLFGLVAIDSHSLLVTSGVVVYTIGTLVYIYRQHALAAAVVAVLLVSPLLVAHQTAHASSIPQQPTPDTQTVENMNCWMATVGWVVVTIGGAGAVSTGVGIVVSAWGQVMAIDTVINYCTDSATGPAFWYLIYWSGGGGGGSW